MSKKASKADIDSVEYVHVDIDPIGDETPDEAKEQALKKLEAFNPPPTATVNSGVRRQSY